MKTEIKISLALFLTISIIFLSISCDTNPFHPDKKSRPVGNLPPETYLFLFTAQTEDSVSDAEIGIDTTASKQILHWWGDDSDGDVIGYYIQWDYQTEPVWTTSEYDTFYVPIRTKFDKFTFKVWAVDNDSIQDPTAAVQTFPVFNSMPEIEFKLRSNPPAGETPDVTNYTFPTRTFMWDVQDPDGIETVTGILYALDDTSSWTRLPGNARSVTLTEISPGEHRFFVKAEDIAGAQSKVISFPDPLDDETPNTWIVKEPQGDILLVNDFAQDQTLHIVQNFYEDILKNIVGEGGYSVWEIGTSRTPAVNQQNSLPYATADVKANLNYFKKVIWFSHLGRPNLSEAGLSITQYIADGGYIFISNGNEEFPDSSWTFTDIDSVYRLNPSGRFFPGVEIQASFLGTEQDTTLDLSVGSLIGNRVSALIPGPKGEIVYRMQPDSTATVPVTYSGSPVVGVRYKVGKGRSIYFSLPFHQCYGNENVQQVMEYILLNEFE